jgi:aryl-alcohol dehydrogenase
MKQGNQTVYGSFFGQSAFATYAIASERNVVKMPKDVPVEMLGPLGCALQTGVGGVFYSFRLNPAHPLPYSEAQVPLA